MPPRCWQALPGDSTVSRIHRWQRATAKVAGRRHAAPAAAPDACGGVLLRVHGALGAAAGVSGQDCNRATCCLLPRSRPQLLARRRALATAQQPPAASQPPTPALLGRPAHSRHQHTPAPACRFATRPLPPLSPCVTDRRRHRAAERRPARPHDHRSAAHQRAVCQAAPAGAGHSEGAQQRQVETPPQRARQLLELKKTPQKSQHDGPTSSGAAPIGVGSSSWPRAREWWGRAGSAA